MSAERPFFRIPPFPRASAARLAVEATAGGARISDSQLDSLVELVGRERVGGTFWARQPELPDEPFTLVAAGNRAQLRMLGAAAGDRQRLVYWLVQPSLQGARTLGSAEEITGPCDPWHMVKRAARVLCGADDELALVAALAERPLTTFGEGRFAELGACNEPDALRRCFRDSVVDGFDYFDPFTGDRIPIGEAIELCAFWRRLIDSNRDIAAALGFARWKRTTVEPLLWGGSSPVRFLRRPSSALASRPVALWKSRVSRQALAELERIDSRIIEVEDGFIRSAGLGAECVPPLSIVVDRVGVHFDPGGPSELERLLASASVDEILLRRARGLRASIIGSGLGKYGLGGTSPRRRIANRRSILVPGQVEDDRAVLAGGAGLTSNLELLRRVRKRCPDAYVLYKPHPDVEAGHRAGRLTDEDCLEVADEIVRDLPISALIDMVDEVHVNTSLAGFEALMRGKPVTTHGVPFYAGWGLTTDLGPVPKRRNRQRSLDELVAIVLILYPRYLDPLTSLPCPPEVLIQRLVHGEAPTPAGLLVRARQLQGWLARRLSAIGAG